MAFKTASDGLGEYYIVRSPANPTNPCQVLEDSKEVGHLVSGLASILIGRGVSFVESRNQGVDTPPTPLLDVSDLSQVGLDMNRVIPLR
jgi:hypothetical protein